MSSNTVASAPMAMPAPASGTPCLSIVPKYKFVKVKDGRGRDIDGLWQRNERFYYQFRESGKNCRRVCLLDEHHEPVKTIQQAKLATEDLRRKRRDGEVPHSGRAPVFNEYVNHYLFWIDQTKAKKPKTIAQERSVLNRWARYFGATRLTQIKRSDINQYVLRRKQSGVGNRTVNMDVLVLGNLFRFAKKEGVYSGTLPMRDWEPLKYQAEKQALLSKEDIDHFCAVAVSKKEDGTPRFKNGAMLADAVRFMSLCGARVKSAFAVRWSDVDWERRQLHLIRETKYSKHIVVDFSPGLESLLRELYSHRLPDTDAVFPGNRSHGGMSVGSLRKTFELVRDAARLPKIKFHGLRHYFISECVMAGVDLLTIASWCGHAGTSLISCVYGHLNSSHKQQAAKKLVFGSRKEPPELNAGEVLDANKLTVAELLQLAQQRMQDGGGQSAAKSPGQFGCGVSSETNFA